MPTLSHCAALVRQHDHDRYLCTLFAPLEAREAWFALFAFSHELAAIPGLVSEEMLGFIRFAWWREALDEIYGGAQVRRHPVVQALKEAVTLHTLPRTPLDTLLDAREERLGAVAFTEPEQWESYFRVTSSTLLTLCAQAAGRQPSDSLDALGIAWGCIGRARAGDDVMLAGLTEKWLDQAGDIPAMFLPFGDAVQYRLKRLKAGKAGGGAFLLPLVLCAKHVLRRSAR